MPLLTPETSSSSRDDVLILTPSQSLPSSRPGAHQEDHKEHQAGSAEPSLYNDSILILGPFAPQRHELTSPRSSGGSSSLYSPRIHRTFTPIAVPIPRYEDCFESPGFDQLEYESSPSLFEPSPESIAQSDDDHIRSENWDRKYPGPMPTEPDHTQIVAERLEADAALFDDTPSPVVNSGRSHTPPPTRPGGKKLRLSPAVEHVQTSPIRWVVQDRTEWRDRSGQGPTQVRGPYTIPQLRGLSLSDDSAPDEDDVCEACYKESNYRTMKRLTPCHHIVCGRCFSAALGSVSQDHPIASCPRCLIHVTGFAKTDSKTRRPLTEALEHPQHGSGSEGLIKQDQGPIVMRIDNVAWVLTPEVVERFLPPDTLSSQTAVPIHIPLDRYDGRTKDYMYIEVASGEAARKVLQTCQNTFMPGGPLTSDRKRAVTITQAPHAELLRELRPQSARELQSLLTLCQASVSTLPPPPNHTSSFVAPNGIAHFVKNRHGPFHALMSILSKVKGKESPSYWDLFHVTSGAIAALASSITRISHLTPSDEQKKLVEGDRGILERLASIFELTFGVKLEHGRLSPL